MLCGGVAACDRYGMCTVRCVEWGGMVCVLCAVLSASHSTQHTVKIPYLDMLAHHRITYNDVVFTES